MKTLLILILLVICSCAIPLSAGRVFQDRFSFDCVAAPSEYSGVPLINCIRNTDKDTTICLYNGLNEAKTEAYSAILMRKGCLNVWVTKKEYSVSLEEDRNK